MSLRIDNLMLHLTRRVVDLMLLLPWRISIVVMLFIKLDVLGELVEELEELDDALLIEKPSLEPLREALLVAHELVGCAWLRLDLNLGGHVAPQVLELHVVVVLGVVPRHLVHLGVGALAPLILVGIDVAVLVLVRM